MMESETSGETVCPVCTLYLRPGITLSAHLASHPKHMVIDALVRLHVDTVDQKQIEPIAQQQQQQQPSTSAQQWPQQSPPVNHSSFIYQHFMSSSAPPNVAAANVNQMGQQYVTVFNPQMMPYMYQQQQVIMSSGPQLPRILHVPEHQEPTEAVIVEEEEDPLAGGEEPPIDEPMDELEPNEVLDEDKENSEIKEADVEEEQIVGIDPDLKDLCTPRYDEVHEPELGSPCSSAGSDFIRVRADLNKSVQTQMEEECPLVELENGKVEYDNDMNYVTLTSSMPNPPATVVNDCEAQTSGNMVDMDGMNLMLNTDYMSTQISQVEDFEYSRCERPQVLMNIGGDYHAPNEICDESISVDSANIRADEPMPPRGELSGQESNASDIIWSRMRYSEPGNSQGLITRETWYGSDVSDGEAAAPTQPEPPPYEAEQDDMPTVSGCSEPPRQYKCQQCGESFTSLKKRRAHKLAVHEGATGAKVKKTIKTEDILDEVFDRLKEEVDPLQDTNVPLPAGEKKESAFVKKDDVFSNPIFCTICDNVAQDFATLRQHQIDVHNFGTEERYRCGTCPKSFKCEQEFTLHLTEHPLECRQCGKYFYRRQNYQLHLRRHFGIRPHKCVVCSKSFLTKQKLEEHNNTHTGDAPLKCSMCDEMFRRYSNLIQHKNRHHLHVKRKTKDFVCHCGEVFHSAKKLMWHNEIHDQKPKACKQCSLKFIHGASLTRHMRRAHNEWFVPTVERENENVKCHVCDKIYLRSSIVAHLKSHEGQRPFTCTHCNKSFSTKWNLKLHAFTHKSRSSKPFKCELCQGAFIRESDYVAHMNSHRAIRPYTCNYCGAKFIRKYNCQRHVREHENTKMFRCEKCDKTFHRSYYLKDHMRVHNEERPYACQICGKASTTKSNHNKHLRIHHAKDSNPTEN